ncbi:hypothetical protein DC522_32875, partial [Microvirga sp. KLBC 81]
RTDEPTDKAGDFYFGTSEENSLGIDITYLRDERGLRPSSIHLYRHNLRKFEAYLERLDCRDLHALSMPVVSGFITTAAQEVGDLARRRRAALALPTRAASRRKAPSAATRRSCCAARGPARR